MAKEITIESLMNLDSKRSLTVPKHLKPCRFCVFQPDDENARVCLAKVYMPAVQVNFTRTDIKAQVTSVCTSFSPDDSVK